MPMTPPAASPRALPASRRSLPPWLALCGLLLALLAASPAVWAGRLALVIGNRDYAVGALKNPFNDAEAMAGALGGLGFQVMLVRNLRRDDIGRTVEGFAGRIRPGDDVVVFYAGHGLQVKGVNYLPAVDASIRVEGDVVLNSLNLNELLQRLDEAKAGVRLLLVDACRDNPYSRSFRSNARGLARVEGAPSGTLMHFATRPGGVAADGTGATGLYTSHLLQHLRTPGLPVESMLKRVAADVRKASGSDQQPWTEGALDGEFYFAGDANASAAMQRPEPAIARPQAAPQPAGPAVGQVVQDCDVCPPLVVIPGGEFVMGSAGNEDGRQDNEGPQHRVSVQPFLLGRTEVTQGQWKAVMGSNPSHFSQCGDDCPVDSVSWNDAQEYLRKLNARAGKASYRLPSEAEWEYAARSGSSQRWDFGDSEQQLGEYAWYTVNSGAKTFPVGQKRANGYGLYDMHGNVYEWVQDVWHDSYNGAPTDGSAWMLGANPAWRVLRSGGWYSDPPHLLRSATRGGDVPVHRDRFVGFRIARTY